MDPLGLNELLRGHQYAPAAAPSATESKGFTNYMPSFTLGDDSSTMVKTAFTYLFYLAAVAFVVFLLLIIVHYAYTPIFSFSSGDGGYIKLASNASDSQLTWEDQPPGSTSITKFTNVLPCGFTLSLDVFIDKDLALSNSERMILYRGAAPVLPDPAKTLQANYHESNLLIYLQKDTNDLVVSAITSDATGTFVESAPTILNVPIQKPFRVSTVFLPNLLEVYMNGRFIGSRVLKGKPLQTATQFLPPPEQFQQTVKILDVAYWARPLLAREIAGAAPKLPPASKFKPSDVSQCSS
jgi:hypothetical protein